MDSSTGLARAGRGLENIVGAFKLWGWYAAVLIVLPLMILFAVLTTLFAIANGAVYWGGLALPLLSAWMMWVLFSKSGRDRYRLMAESIARRKSRPKFVAEYRDIGPES